MYCVYVGFDYTYIDINALAQGIKSFLASQVWFQAIAGARTYGTDSPAITSQPHQMFGHRNKYVCMYVCMRVCMYACKERDVAQSIACPPLKRSVVGSILLSGPSCSLGCFPFQPVVHNWFIKGRGMYCSVYGKVHIKDPLLLIEKSSLCGGSGFPSKKCVNVTI